MSDTSDDIHQCDRNNDKEDNICRDYVRGLCERKFCKFKHDNEPRQLNFCHDFQNHLCPRIYCKFIHCSVDDADEFKRSGQMSCQILTEATKKNQLPGALNICNQYRKGQCRRANCKYRHITKEQEDAEVAELIHSMPQQQAPVVLNNNINEGQVITLGTLNNIIRRNGVNFEEYKDEGLPLLKRRFITTQEHEILPCEILEQPTQTRPIFKGYFAGNPPSPIWNRIDTRSIMLEEENSILHKEVAQLKKQVSDLTATNEFLLDQNATLRLSGKRGVSSVGPTPQQQVNRTVIASVATVPVSLATVSTCNPVSGNHSVSIAGCPTVSIAPATPQLMANSQQILVTTNPTTQLAIANSSQAHLAIAQQNLANNLAAQQPQLALATTTQQHMANQQLALANAPQQTQQLTLATSAQAQQLALASTSQQLSSQAQQLALASTNQQLTSQAQQLALASTTQQLSTQAQQLAMANTPQQLAVASVALAAGTNQQLIAQQNLATEMHRNSQMNAIQTSQAIAMSNATQPMVSFPIMTQSMSHALTH